MVQQVGIPAEFERGAGRMSPRAAAWLAWSLWALSSTLTALSILLLILTSSHSNIFDYWVESTLISVSCSTVGALIASRRPENPTGWIFCALGLAAGVRHFGAEYAIYALLVEPGSLPFGEVLAWITSWIRVPYFSLFVYVALVFPDGRLPPGRWQWVAWLTAIVVAVGTISVAFSRGATRGLGPISNPFAIEWVPRVATLVEVLIFALGIVAGASLFARLRHATWVERQQIKWFAYSITVTASGAILTYSIGEALGVGWVRGMGFVFVIVGLVGISTSVGIAILRYRLYEIDHIINRTLVYGSLTATLVALYVGGVVLLQRVFVVLTGERSTLAVVASTLLIAALFNPLRRRIQSFIDRRFYRRKYDARKTLEAFSAQLRNDTDLEALSDDLVGVVRETMQPAHVSLWLRPEMASKGQQAG
jgi:hypothetical protein